MKAPSKPAPSKPARKPNSQTKSINDVIGGMDSNRSGVSSGVDVSTSYDGDDIAAAPAPPPKPKPNFSNKPPPPPKNKSSNSNSNSSNSSNSSSNNNPNNPIPISRAERVITAESVEFAQNYINQTRNKNNVNTSSDSNNNRNSSEEIDGNEFSIEISSIPEISLDKPRYERIFDLNNKIFHKFRFAPLWVLIALIFHIGQFSILLSIAYRMDITPGGIFVLVTISILTIILLIYAKCIVRPKNSKNSIFRLIELHKKKMFDPDDEIDDIPDRAIYALALAGILEGVLFAIFSALTAGNDHHLNDSGFYSRNTILQTLRFASINLLAFHRILRPANRADPMRTMFELEVVGVCWDALDGSTLWDLFTLKADMSSSMQGAIKVLMIFWYISVGSRISCMYLTALPPDNKIYQFILSLPLALSPSPTVDRTMQGLVLRSFITILMTGAELCAAIIRIILWSRGLLNSIQQDMCIKNFLFITNIQSAINFKINASLRNWNSRDLGFGINIPTRGAQIEIFRWLFAFFYCVQGAIMSVILIQVTGARLKWLANIGFDFFLVIVFLVYCRKVHIQNSSLPPQCFLVPSKGYHIFPWNFTFLLSFVMFLNLFIARVPLIYYSFDTLNEAVTDAKLWTYNDALLVVNLSVITFILGSSFWSICYMMFRKEFTACPGDYNAIHDPTINMVVSASVVEGALDVLSATSLMQLASYPLPTATKGFVALFILLELINAFQSFAFQIVLSGGHDDTPMDLVKWKSKLRFSRFFIDLGAFILRIILWRQYDVISSVFLIKNLYNLLHAFAQIERSFGLEKYPPGTLFCEFVTPSEWYGLTMEEWRIATKSTLAAQARAGRKV